MRIGSLFSGIGGLELGVEAHGHETIWQAESDPFARQVLAKHWPTVRCFSDVKEIDEQAPPVDIICGGFPCQDISNAGKRVGIGGSRSGLWSEFARIVGVLRPRYVFIENVAVLVVRGLDRVLADLAALGFDAEWDCFRASDVGAPHRRERLFILAVANGAGRERQGPAQPARWISDAEPAGAGAHVEHAAQLSEHRWPPGPDAWASGRWPADAAQPSIRRGADGVRGRVDRLRCLGNAVIPQVAALAWGTLMERAGR